MNAYLNMGMRVLTETDVKHFRGPPLGEIAADEEERLLGTVLAERVLLDTEVPAMIAPPEEVDVGPEDLAGLGLTKEEEEEKEELAKVVDVPEVTTQKQTNTFTIELPQGMNMNMNTVTPSGLEETTLDELPYSEDVAPPPAMQQQGGGNNGVNVQTSSQPVLVIPMNVGAPPAPTEFIQSPMRGAPGTFAVDTSPRALNSMGLAAAVPQRGGATPRRSRGGAPPKGAPVVTVQRQGSSSPSNAANVRVQVTKQG
jgi:hypothetical protein